MVMRGCLMNRPPAILWLVLLLLLLPTAAGRILIDVLGGVALVLIAVPFILAGLGWIGWKLLQMQVPTTQPQPGEVSSNPSVSASDVTIDVTAQEVGSDS